MAHREQHGNREAKKPKKDQGSRSAEPKKWEGHGNCGGEIYIETLDGFAS